MTASVGVWIDHRKAVIVSITDGADQTTSLESEVDPHVRFSGGSRPGSTREGAGESTRERNYEHQLGVYYDDVIARIRPADTIFIFGPGEAKQELHKRLERQGLGARVLAVEAADKLTDAQIAARVRKQFQH